MKLKFLFLFLLISSCAFSQGIRVGDSLPLQTTAVIQGTTVIVPVGIASIQMCTAPANATPCTNKATTYTDRTLGTPCSTATQVVLAGTSSCVANSDSIGNWGVWVASGNYEWTFTNSSGASFGPYPVTAQASPALNTWSALTAPTGNLSLSMGSNTTSFNYAGGVANGAAFSFAPSSSTGLSVFGQGEIALSGNATSSFEISPLVMLGGISGLVPAIGEVVCIQALTGSPSAVFTRCGVANTKDVVGICFENCSSGTAAVIAWAGITRCSVDATGVSNVGDWAIVSTVTSGKCRDGGGASSPPTTVTAIGRFLESGSGSLKVWLQINR